MDEPRSGRTISEPAWGEELAAYCEALAARHLSRLTFPEVRRGLEALSAVYVERRDKLALGAALDGAGKRAAFALFYGPLHFAVIRGVARELALAAAPGEQILDLGCGTGAAGAALALALGAAPRLLGVDVSRWAVAEARWTWRHFGLTGDTRVGDAARPPPVGRDTFVLAAYTVNELEPAAREDLLRRLRVAAGRGARILVVEPIARRPTPWWESWVERFAAFAPRTDTWRFTAELPPRLKLLDKAAGLRHDALKARSLYVGPVGRREAEPRPASLRGADDR